MHLLLLLAPGNMMGPIDAAPPMQSLIVGIRLLGLPLRYGHLLDQSLGDTNPAGRSRRTALGKHGRGGLLTLDRHSHFTKKLIRLIPQDFTFSRS